MFVLKKKKHSKRHLECRKSGKSSACCFRSDRIITTELSTAGRPDYKDFIKLPAAISHIIPQSAGNMQQLSFRYECICPHSCCVFLIYCCNSLHYKRCQQAYKKLHLWGNSACSSQQHPSLEHAGSAAH